MAVKKGEYKMKCRKGETVLLRNGMRARIIEGTNKEYGTIIVHEITEGGRPYNYLTRNTEIVEKIK